MAQRYREEGAAGLQDRSFRRHHYPRRIPRQRRRMIERLRRKGWSGPRSADELKMPVSTVTVELRRLGLNRLSKLAPPVPVVRYKRNRPSELVHMDIKKLARIERVGNWFHFHASSLRQGAAQ